MESAKRTQPWRTLVFCGIFGALLLAQGAASLRCYSCRDFDDGGCAPDRITIEECAPPRNVCLEALHVVTLDNLTLSAAIKGCDVGTLQDSAVTYGPLESSTEGSRIRACSENLCNTLVNGDFLKRPDNGSRPSVPRDNECYYCLSTSEDQCSAKKDAVMKCRGDEEVCYNETSTITLGNLHSITVPYFMKKCSDSSCSQLTTNGQFLQYNKTGSCCRGNLCNGFVSPNAGLRPTTCVAHLILAAILAMTRI